MTELLFDESNPLVSLGGYSNFSGIKGVNLGSIDLTCVKNEETRAEEEETVDAALSVAGVVRAKMSSSDFSKTILTASIMFAVMAIIIFVVCVFASKQLVDEMNESFATTT